jgi:hypothetical protein
MGFEAGLWLLFMFDREPKEDCELLPPIVLLLPQRSEVAAEPQLIDEDVEAGAGKPDTCCGWRGVELKLD